MRPTWIDILWLIAFPCVVSGAQLLMRITAAHAAGKSLAAAVSVYFRQPSFYGALAVFAAATLLWLWILSRYPLALAYPFTTLAFVIVPLLERFIYGARTNTRYWVGLGLIVIGALAIARAHLSM
jgi:drug/metabolite transporter (DMT)-like permease